MGDFARAQERTLRTEKGRDLVMEAEGMAVEWWCRPSDGFTWADVRLPKVMVVGFSTAAGRRAIEGLGPKV